MIHKNSTTSKLTICEKLQIMKKETLEKNGKVIVWPYFRISVNKLADYFNKEGYKTITITGAVPKDDDENA